MESQEGQGMSSSKGGQVLGWHLPTAPRLGPIGCSLRILRRSSLLRAHGVSIQVMSDTLDNYNRASVTEASV